MFKILFAFNEMQPLIQIKRLAQRFYYFNEGQKQRRKAERLISKIEYPKYKISNELESKLQTNLKS